MPAYLKPLGKGRPVILDKPILFVGRHPECDIILLNSRKVSRKHCCIALVDNAFRVRDLGSTNGVSVNGARIQKEGEVKVGDEVSFGDVAYILLQGEAPAGADRNGAAADAAKQQSVLPPVSGSDLPELSQQFPVAIDDDDEPVSISQLKSTPEKIPTPSGPAKLRRPQEDSDSDVVLLDEGEYFLDDDDDE